MTTMHFILLLNIYLIWRVSALTKFFETDDITLKNPGVHFDDIEEDDHGDFELSEIIAASTESTGVEWQPTPELRKKSVELHNALRRNHTHPFPEASDMPMLEYNNTLEWTAWEYARKCIYDHGKAENDNMTHDEGQSIYQGPHSDPSRAIYRFYHVEYPSYNFNNHTCMANSQFGCGHMQNIMMAKTEHLGFTVVANCWPRNGNVMVFFHYILGIIEKYPSTIHWKYGPVCSRCKPGYYCAGELCIPQPERFCKAYNLDCECVRTCHNCVTPDYKNCRCNTCKLGWDWADCSYPCQNRLEVIENSKACRNNQWALDKCKEMVGQGQKSMWGWITRENQCRATCGTCQVVTHDADPEKLCCGGKICKEFYALDTNTCECQLLCPSQDCMYYTNTTTTSTTTTTTSTTSTTTTSPSSSITTTSPKIFSTRTTVSDKSTIKQESHPISTTVSEKPTTKQEPRPISTAFMVNPKLKMFLISFIFIFSFV